MTLRPGVWFRVRLAQNELRNLIKTHEFEIPPMECRARRSRAVFKISTGSHTPCGQVCRGGSRGPRPFPRGRGGEEHAGVRART